MTGAAEAQFDAVMQQPLALEARTETRFLQDIDRSLLQHAGTNPLYDVSPASIFDND